MTAVAQVLGHSLSHLSDHVPDRVSAGSRLRTAMEARDARAAAEAFAVDAVFYSPLTAKLSFQGRERIAVLAGIVLEVFEDFRYTNELMGESEGFLVARAKIDGLEIELVDHLRFGPDGSIASCTVFFRPLPAAAAALRRIGAALGRQRSRGRGMLIATLSRPLGWMTRIGDIIGAGLLRGVV